jgi:hypothetical protein
MDSLVPFSPSSPSGSVTSTRGPAVDQQRAGDQERNAVCSQLSAHFAAGRLSADELDARLGAAVQAVTLQQLRQLLSDLPAPGRAVHPVRAAAPAGPTWGALEVIALLVMLGALGVAAIAVLGLGAMGQFAALTLGFLGGSTAALGGAALTHLLHHHARSRRLPEQQDQRPRIA